MFLFSYAKNKKFHFERTNLGKHQSIKSLHLTHFTISSLYSRYSLRRKKKMKKKEETQNSTQFYWTRVNIFWWIVWNWQKGKKDRFFNKISLSNSSQVMFVSSHFPVCYDERRIENPSVIFLTSLHVSLLHRKSIFLEEIYSSKSFFSLCDEFFFFVCSTCHIE